ncbi:MAG: acetyltransferase [Bacteroidota bacterium]
MSTKSLKDIIIIGYSGHAYVALDIILAMGERVVAYCDQEEKSQNPYQLQYLGKEEEELAFRQLRQCDYFIGIGNNQIRCKVQLGLTQQLSRPPINVIHPTVTQSPHLRLGKGVMFAPHVIINSMTKIGDGVICNSGAIIEHECQIDNFVHIAPGAVLAGNVSVGEESFIGANTVVKEGICIGKKVTIGAGSVIIRDIPDGVTVVGNPNRIIKRHDQRTS